MPTPAVTVENLTKVFPIPFKRRQLVAVRDLSITVEQGQVYGLLGPNGSGKSTTLKAVLGLLTPTEGRTAIFGIDSSEVSSRDHVGYLPENPYFYKYLSGEETLMFFGKICGIKGRALRDRVKELLVLVGLQNAADRRLGGYSKGMLQRIGLAQALIQQPRLVVLDEPTAGVDPVGSREIRDLILRLRDDGITVLLCSHLLGQVQEICDRVGILAQGQLVREGPLNDLISLDHRAEIIIEQSTPEALEAIKRAATDAGAKVVESRKSRTTLERLFLDATGSNSTVKQAIGTDAAKPASQDDTGGNND